MQFICKYCGIECKNKNSLTQHEIRCKLNPNALNVKDYIKPGHSKGHIGSNQFIKAKQLGTAIPVVSDITKQKISIKTTGKQMSEQSKQKISAAMKIIAKEKPDVYCGQQKMVELKNIYIMEFILMALGKLLLQNI